MRELKSGDILGGRYEVVSKLGGGSFGRTHIAQDLQRPSHPKCVVKQLKPENNHPQLFETALRLFDKEAEILELLGSHPQIPQLLAHFREEEEFFLVQELINGTSLSTELNLGRQWAEKQVIETLQDILTVLEFVHEKKVIHRDIKPENIIRRSLDGRVVLVDFGSVKQLSGPLTYSSSGQVTPTVAIGTQGYMPTEQIRGKPRPNSDIYAVGVIAIQAVTGLGVSQLPENPETGEINWKPWAKISSSLVEILEKMTRYHFRERYQSVTEVLNDLAAINLLIDGSVSSAENFILTENPTEATRDVSFQENDISDQSNQLLVSKTSVSKKAQSPNPTLVSTFPSSEVRRETVFSPTSNETSTSSQANVKGNEFLQKLAKKPRNWILFSGTAVFLLFASFLGLRLLNKNIDESDQRRNATNSSSIEQTSTRHTATVLNVAVHPDDSYIASGSYDQTAKIWDIRTGKVQRTLNHSGRVNNVLFDPNGSFLVTGGGDGDVVVWDLSSASEEHRFSGRSGRITSLAISPNAQLIVSGSEKGTIRVWDLNQRQELFTLDDTGSQVNSLAFSPVDNGLLISGAQDGKITIWDLQKQESIQSLNASQDRVTGIDISPDGQFFASSSYDGTVRIWELSSGAEEKVLRGHDFVTTGVAFSPDGQSLASSSFDETIKVWDWQQGVELCNLEGHSGFVYSVAFDQVGTMLISGGFDGTIRFWKLEDEDCYS